MFVMARPHAESANFQQFPINFRFEIAPVSDQAPKRICAPENNCTILISEREEKLISPRDLLFFDPDLHVDQRKIRFSFPSDHPQGGFFMQSHKEIPKNDFTQVSQNTQNCTQNAQNCTKNTHNCTKNTQNCTKNAQNCTQNTQNCTKNTQNCTQNYFQLDIFP